MGTIVKLTFNILHIALDMRGDGDDSQINIQYLTMITCQAYRSEQNQIKERKAAKRKEKEEKDAVEKEARLSSLDSATLVTRELAQTVENGETGTGDEEEDMKTENNVSESARPSTTSNLEPVTIPDDSDDPEVIE